MFDVFHFCLSSFPSSFLRSWVSRRPAQSVTLRFLASVYPLFFPLLPSLGILVGVFSLHTFSFSCHGLAMRVVQRRSSATAGPRASVNDLDPTGVTIQPMQIVFSCAVFIVSVILLHFFVKLTS